MNEVAIYFLEQLNHSHAHSQIKKILWESYSIVNVLFYLQQIEFNLEVWSLFSV